MWNPADHGEWFFQQSPFAEIVSPPTAEVCDPPLYCFQVNGSYIPLICGALTVLAQPSTFGKLSDADRVVALGRMQDLIAEIGSAMPCQQPPVPPPNPQPDPPCSIAGYLSNFVIREAIYEVVQNIQNGLNVLNMGLFIIGIMNSLWGGILIAGLFYTAELALIKFIAEVLGGNLGDYQEALGDESLWNEVTCAIYNCIKIDGKVTQSNYGCIVSQLCNLTYPLKDVKDAICGYITNLGADALISAQQGGPLVQFTNCCGGYIGPPYKPPLLQSGRARVLIAAGRAIGTVVVPYLKHFVATPILLPGGSNDPIMLPSFSGASTSGFTLDVTAPRPVDVDTVVEVDWVAQAPTQQLIGP